jgi:thiol-disulfide isomerase/thioredoxin
MSGQAFAESASLIINDAYPGLASGVLSFAKDANLPPGILLRAGSLVITANQLQLDVDKAHPAMREQLKKNSFFHLEQVATNKLLLMAAKQDSNSTAAKTDDELIKNYIGKVISTVKTSDDEVAKFYEANKEMCGGATLGQIKDQLREYVLQQKQQEAIDNYITTLGQRMPIEVSSSWVKEQAKLAKDNPVDKARFSGLPSLIDFGSTGCKPCDMMAPVLENLKKKYTGKVNVLFVHVREEPILAGRYGVKVIPVQIFFDKTGKEIARHSGFYPQVEIEKQLQAMGVTQ